MITIDRILVSTDFSDNASAAYGPARQLAGRYGAVVDFIHIIPSQSYLSGSVSELTIPIASRQDLQEQIEKEATKKLETLMDDFLDPEVRGRGIVTLASKPAKAIADYAETEGYDLIMMAAKGRHRSDFFRGSTTKKMIRYSSVPVFSTENPDIEGLKNILIPTDGSADSLRALPMALSLALMYDGDIILYNAMVLRSQFLEGVSEDYLHTAYRQIKEELLAELERYFSTYEKEVELQETDAEHYQLLYHDGGYSVDINLETVIQKEVSAHEAIVEYAREEADIIVMATPSRSGFLRLLHGSTTEEIAGQLALPVITVQA